MSEPTPQTAASDADALDAADAEARAMDAALQGRQPLHVVEAAFERFGPALVVSFSGAEDVLVVDLAVQVLGARAAGELRVLTLDTGRLHPETLRYLEEVRQHYGIALQVRSPDAAATLALVQRKGLFSFYVDGHKECCGLRKVAPLRLALADVPAWMTGQRRDQSPDTRATVPLCELDRGFSSQQRPLFKFNPLANWKSAEVWRYLRGAGIPTNPLHQRGFISIGCEPCTRAVGPGEHERAGRWWWEEATQKECGLHRPEGA